MPFIFSHKQARHLKTHYQQFQYLSASSKTSWKLKQISFWGHSVKEPWLLFSLSASCFYFLVLLLGSIQLFSDRPLVFSFIYLLKFYFRGTTCPARGKKAQNGFLWIAVRAKKGRFSHSGPKSSQCTGENVHTVNPSTTWG